MNRQMQNSVLKSFTDKEIMEMTGVKKVGLEMAFKKYKYRETAVRRLVYLNNPVLYYSREWDQFRRS